jgi:hypothetical protein
VSVALFLAASLLFACTDVDPDIPDPYDVLADPTSDIGLVGQNSCGGTDSLELEGAAATPGDACGPCEVGVAACLGADQLQCIGALELNACGGCAPLFDAPGRLCGACGVGGIECADGEDSVLCVGDRPLNACGGCAVLAAEPGGDCGSDVESAEWICGSPDEVRCVSIGENPCGGASGLDEYPGTLCGQCERSVFECVGAEAIACANPSAGVNACGGCSRLLGEPGAACGDCGGFFECDDDGQVFCNRERNSCGGCGELRGVPGAACGGGNVWVCTVGADVLCAPTGTNACGGREELATPAGGICGPCDDGIWTCVDRNATACLRATEENACGTCGTLAGEPGQRCAANAIFVCSDGEAKCETALETNPCGGTTLLGAVLGEACGLCESGALECAGNDAVVCAGELLAADLTWYPDEDEDAFYPDGAPGEVYCDPPGPGFSQEGGDCDDDNERAYPGADENECVDQIDLNCDGIIGFVDADNDGSSECFDCDDRDRRVFPGAPEICNGADDDCDGRTDEGARRTFYIDADGDGFGDGGTTAQACTAPTGYVARTGDCDDDAFTTHPGADEWCDGVDNDCDEIIDPPTSLDALTWYPDVDGDGYGDPLGDPVVACVAPPGSWADNDLDCNDGDAAIYPDASEVCDGVDNNCDRVVDTDAVDRIPRWRDQDGDNHGEFADPVLACPLAAGFADTSTDCDDSRREVYPGAPERVGDGLDSDCNLLEACYIDVDGDGYIGDFSVVVDVPDLTCSDTVTCPDDVVAYRADGLCHLSRGTTPADDCDEGSPAVFPGAEDAPGDGVDANCDGWEVCYRDPDADNYVTSFSAIVVTRNIACDGIGEVGNDIVRGEGDCWDVAFAADESDCVDVSGDAGTRIVCPDDVNPAAITETDGTVDGVNYNCDATVPCLIDIDMDEFAGGSGTFAVDGRGPLVACNTPTLTTQFASGTESSWCDDSAAVRPGAADSPYDGTDSNCDGVEVCRVDRDWDGYRTVSGAETATVSCGAGTGCSRHFDSGGGADVVWLSAPSAFGLCNPTGTGGTRSGLATGSAPTGDCNDRVASTFPGAADAADTSPTASGSDLSSFDTNCDGRDGIAATEEYVRCGGSGCLGTAVQIAVNRCVAKSGACTVYLEEGVYNFTTPLVVRPDANLSIEGGYNASFTARYYGGFSPGWDAGRGFGSGGTATELFASAPNTTSPAIAADIAPNGRVVRVSGVRVRAHTAPRGSATSRSGHGSFGIVSSGSGRLDLVRASVTSGLGGAGADYGTPAGIGLDSTRDGWPGGAGGSNGASGSSGLYHVGSQAGGAGGGGVTYSVCDYDDCGNGSAPGTGGAGGVGAYGSCGGGGGAGTWRPSSLTTTWPLSTAGAGSAGSGGVGGGAGGGGGSYRCVDSGSIACGAGSTNSVTAGGGGGGGNGGNGGAAGAGGHPGGPSIAILATGSTTVNISETTVTSLKGGDGGNGQGGGSGLAGEAGGAGGAGASNTFKTAGSGGGGGRGASGGGGGGGAGGSGGASIAIARNNSAAVIIGAGVPRSVGIGGSGGNAGAAGMTPAIMCAGAPIPTCVVLGFGTACVPSPAAAGATAPAYNGYNYDTGGTF